ncbi:MAG TPA: neutral/alkaline non-lysosomal ceramidase N-terminal domain-containing protein [Anaerolineales bacterium]|nr:neutral/alkaline non-lysosomal ceramidase N-terminal domain-containing protein [Anaerolineales bacterium]
MNGLSTRELKGEPGTYQAAALAVDITPPIGTRFDGYGARKEASNDIHDPLFASLLLIRAGGAGAALVTLDLLAVTLNFTSRLRAALAPVLELPESAILVSATHTHSGPAGFLGRVLPLGSQEDPIQQEICLRKLAGAALRAKNHLQPVHLGFGWGQVHDLGGNRNDPSGPLDVQVGVLRVDDLQHRPLAVLMNYGCHPTVLGPENLAISADFPGAARAALDRIYPGTLFLFTNGASGDVSTRFTRRSQGFAEVERMGNILAGEVLKVMQLVTPVQQVSISSRISPVKLPVRNFPPLEAARKQVEQLQAELARMRAAGLPHGEIRKAVTRLEGAQAQLIMVQSAGDLDTTDTQVQVLRIGPLALAALPGEPFTRLVLEIKDRSPVQPLLVVSYGNDYRGYFPDAASVAAGTYEALFSPYDETASRELVQAALALLG